MKVKFRLIDEAEQVVKDIGILEMDSEQISALLNSKYFSWGDKQRSGFRFQVESSGFVIHSQQDSAAGIIKEPHLNVVLREVEITQYEVKVKKYK